MHVFWICWLCMALLRRSDKEETMILKTISGLALLTRPIAASSEAALAVSAAPSPRVA